MRYRAVLAGMTAIATATASLPARAAPNDPGRAKVAAAIRADHDAAVERLRAWIKLPTIANMGINHKEGAEYMRQLALDAGFQMAKVIPTSGVPGVFATLDAGAKDTLALYFMYDVKHYDPAEWSSPPLEGRLVDRPGEGPFWLTAPRPTITLPSPGRSTIRPSSGGDDHSAGS